MIDKFKFCFKELIDASVDYAGAQEQRRPLLASRRRVYLAIEQIEQIRAKNFMFLCDWERAANCRMLANNLLNEAEAIEATLAKADDPTMGGVLAPFHP